MGSGTLVEDDWLPPQTDFSRNIPGLQQNGGSSLSVRKSSGEKKLMAG
jgi:hypothetical protein